MALATLTLASVGIPALAAPPQTPVDTTSPKLDWPIYGGSAENDHYSYLQQINRSNVKHLKPAWSFDTGETGGFETTPLIIDGKLYGITPSQKILALNAATGRLLWKFDSGVGGRQNNRGLTYWGSGADQRIFVGIASFVYALDARTGRVIPTFGDAGRIDLRENLGRDAKSQSVSLTTPGVIYRDLLIVGDRVPETLPCPPGDIRAYDVHTGKLRWSFHTIPHPGEVGYETWPPEAWKTSGAANNWAGMAVDSKRGIVYVPTGSASSDFYGADRIGDDLFANCLLALDAQTGRRIWHFQAVKHDLWDRDFPSPPVLLTVERNGKPVDAVAQPTKQGFVYLFDRTNGEPLFPIEYRSYPPSTIPGEVAATTQPLPTMPAPFARQLVTHDLLTTRTPEAHEWALKEFQKVRSEGQFVPFSLGKETIIFPGFDGGAEWGGSAVDPETQIIYVNANDVAYTGGMVETSGTETGGKEIYLSQCSVCHGADMAGSPPEFPSLKGIGTRIDPNIVYYTIIQGKGRMPSFPNLSDMDRNALMRFLTGKLDNRDTERLKIEASVKYHFTGYRRFLDPEGYPAVAPPWGTLNAINLNTGEYAWKIPLGEYPALAAQGMKDTGTENYGGPVVTAGGLVFIAATSFDRKIRAFDKSTGKLLWEAKLPFAGNATPATYMVNGRQYVVIGAGGGKDITAPSGGVYVAFALAE